MICRWVRDEAEPIEPFDWFNDGPDTYRWLKAYHPERAPAFLEAAEAADAADWTAH